MKTSTPSLPGLGQALALLGMAEKQAAAGQFDLAVQSYVRAIDACPLYAASYCDFIVMLLKLNEIANAARVVAAIPPQVYQGCPPAQNLHGVVLLQQGRHTEAIERLSTLVGAPGVDQAMLFHNLGTCYNRQDKLDEALAWYERAHQAGQRTAAFYQDWAGILQKQEDIEGATRLYDKARKLFPGNSDLRYEYSLFLLRNEQYALGFKLYAERWKSSIHGARPWPMPIPAWDGRKPIRSLLVLPEQGMGDQIVFSALLRTAMERVPAVTAALDPRLAPLLLRSFPGLRTVAGMLEPDVIQRDYDAYVYAADLGALFPDAVTWQQGWLKADEERVRALRQSLQARFPGKTLVGLSWKSVRPVLGEKKSIGILQWKPVLQREDCAFISLQYGDVADDLRLAREELGVTLHLEPEIDCFNDLDGLAALANACDRVITTSNSTAHLAAATNAPTWVLLPKGAGVFWYWGFAPDRTRWYPHIRLFRTRDSQDWTALIDTVAARLGETLT